MGVLQRCKERFNCQTTAGMGFQGTTSRNNVSFILGILGSQESQQSLSSETSVLNILNQPAWTLLPTYRDSLFGDILLVYFNSATLP